MEDLEATRRSLQLKHAASESGFALLSLLRKLDCRQHEFYMHDLLSVFYSVDVMLHRRILDWLVEGFGWEEGNRIMREALASWKCLPLAFERTASYGIVVVCRSGESKDMTGEVCGDGDGADDDTSDAKADTCPSSSATSKFITEVQATSESRPFVAGTILATVREGDMLCLKSHSSRWWFVFEMRRKVGTVLLSSRLASARGSKPEYKEVRLAALLGCMVRREGVLSARTLQQLQRTGLRLDLDFSERLICRPEEAAAEGYAPGAGDAYDGPGSRRLSVLFQMPGPDMRSSLVRMRALADEFSVQDLPSAPSSSSAPGPGPPAAPLAPLKQMQAQAQARVYVQRWEEAQRARQLLARADPFAVVLSRERWLLLCRALRTVSRGGSELLQDFVQFTRKAGREGLLRARDCKIAWESLRPATSSDLPALAKARAYLKMRGAGKDAVFFDDEGRLRPEAMQIDALSRGILEAAATYLADRNVVFLRQPLQGTMRVAATAALHLEDGAETTVAATYEHFVDCEVDPGAGVEARTAYLSEEVVRASLAAGDALLVRGAVGGGEEYDAPSGKKQTWVQLVAVDLLFSRLRVVPCAAPPLCWYPQHAQHGEACWLPLSRVWDVTACRLLLPGALEEADAGVVRGFRGRHLIFVCPMPSPAEALAVLAALDRAPAAATLIVVAPKSAPHGAKQTRFGQKKAGLRGTVATTTTVAGSATASSKQAKLSISALSYFTDAVVVAWTPVRLDPRAFINVRGEIVAPLAAECYVRYELEVALVSAPYTWLAVYAGRGLGCQISGLEPLSQYYCRITASPEIPQTDDFRRGGAPSASELYADQRRAQTVITTLGSAVACCPAALAWEATSSGSARGLVAVFDEATWVQQPLPAECFYQVEVALGGDADAKWIPAGRTRSARVSIVGPFFGKSILLRTRVINQLSQPGTSSPVAIVTVPEVGGLGGKSGGVDGQGLKRAGAAKGIGLNVSGISELTMT